MYKKKERQKSSITTSDLIKEIKDYNKNKKEKYNTKTLNPENINNYKINQKREYNTKTLKTCITSNKDSDSINKEIKKKKNKGKLDLGCHRNKDIFIEVDSEQYDSDNINKGKNRCTKLLVDNIISYPSQNYLNQSDIDPYYSVKTFNNYNIIKPFNKKNEKNKKEIYPNQSEIIYNKNINKTKKIKNSKHKYPFVISLKLNNNNKKNKNKNHIPQNSNLSYYLNRESNNIFSLTDDNNSLTEEKEKDSLPDYQLLYIKKEEEYNALLQKYNEIQTKLNNNKNKINSNITKKKFIGNISFKDKKNDINKILAPYNNNQINIKAKEGNYYVINKINDIHLLPNINNNNKNFSVNSYDLKIENNININLIREKNNKLLLYEKSKFDININSDRKNKIFDLLEINDIISFDIKGRKNKIISNINKKNYLYISNYKKDDSNLKLNPEEIKNNNLSVDFSDILDELGGIKEKNNKLKNNNKNIREKKYEIKKNIKPKINNDDDNNNKDIKKREKIIENNMDKIIEENKYIILSNLIKGKSPKKYFFEKWKNLCLNNKPKDKKYIFIECNDENTDINQNEILKINNDDKDNILSNEELPNISLIRDKIRINIIKRKNMLENEFPPL